MSAEAMQPTRAIYYDTSVYVRLNPPTLLKLIEAESVHGIGALAHPLVIGELLNKLSNPESKRLKYDRPALRRLWDHCSVNGRLRVTPPIQIRVLRDLFGQVHEMREWRREMKRTIPECLNTLDQHHWSKETTRTVAACKDMKERQNARYYELKAQILDSTSRFAAGEEMGPPVELHLMALKRVVYQACKEGEVDASEEERAGYVERLADLYPLGVQCEARFLKGVGIESTEPNDMVDNQILFSVSTTHWDDELPSRLVTCENDHITIAAESHEGSVIHWDDYFRELGVTPVIVDRTLPRPDA